MLGKTIPFSGDVTHIESLRRLKMAKKGNRILVKMRSTESPHMYWTEKNRRNDPNRLELRKYDPILRKHALYRETK
jgi:large subunit ribosomal protein L33